MVHKDVQPRLFRARSLTMAALDDLHEKNKVRRLDGHSAHAPTVGSSLALDEAMPRSVRVKRICGVSALCAEMCCMYRDLYSYFVLEMPLVPRSKNNKTSRFSSPYSRTPVSRTTTEDHRTESKHIPGCVCGCQSMGRRQHRRLVEDLK